MPTFNRRHLLPITIRCYLEQDWQEKELVVVDDGTDCVEDLFRDVPNCRYFRTEKFSTVGEKVNFACKQTHGEVIVTWDDDDWYAPNRITDQVTRLVESGKSMTGYHTILFFDGTMASRYSNPPNYCTGTSQVYTKAFWRDHPFSAKDVGYDNDLGLAAASDRIAVDGWQMVVARIHGQNVSGRRSISSPHDRDAMWRYVDNEELPAEFMRAIS